MNPLSRIDPDDPYPESDGEPMAENTLQFDWIVRIKENLEIRFADDPEVFVAGDLLWYPEADRRVSGPLAPDAMVVFGRPKGPRGCYKQWEEGGIAPQVVFEILSPSNSAPELRHKRAFYEKYGVEEYYVYDPNRNRLEIWQRQGARLRSMIHVNGWISPRLGIRFALTRETLEVFHPDGTPFWMPVDLARRRAAAERRAAEERRRADEERQRAAAAERRAAEERRRADEERQRAAAADWRAAEERRQAEQERQRVEEERQRAAAAERRAEDERQRAEQERLQANQERQRAEQAERQLRQLAARLRALGIDPADPAQPE